jgi:hypothetical protein
LVAGNIQDQVEEFTGSHHRCMFVSNFTVHHPSFYPSLPECADNLGDHFMRVTAPVVCGTHAFHISLRVYDLQDERGFGSPPGHSLSLFVQNPFCPFPSPIFLLFPPFRGTTLQQSDLY